MKEGRLGLNHSRVPAFLGVVLVGAVFVCLCRDQQTWLNMVPAESMAVLERSIQARAACMTLPIDGSLTPQPYPIWSRGLIQLLAEQRASLLLTCCRCRGHRACRCCKRRRTWPGSTSSPARTATSSSASSASSARRSRPWRYDDCCTLPMPPLHLAHASASVVRPAPPVSRLSSTLPPPPSPLGAGLPAGARCLQHGRVVSLPAQPGAHVRGHLHRRRHQQARPYQPTMAIPPAPAAVGGSRSYEHGFECFYSAPRCC